MSIKDDIVAAIQQEIQNDPMGRGYAGKSDEEIVELLNTPYFKEIAVTQDYPARINQILIGIAGAPNIISLDDFQFVRGE